MNLEERIFQFLPAEEGEAKTLLSAMNYSMRAGGKRVRPTLMWETYRMFGGEEEVIWPFASAMEMVHTYSLVHDDLPAMDNDRLRRGKPTTWDRYGEDMGILAGDGLLTYAFETAARGFSLTETPERAARALALLAKKAGLSGMVGGQAVDVEQTGKPLSAETLDFIYRNKTSALLEASLMIGGILAGAADPEISVLEQIGTDLGLAFQIRDDILDVISTDSELGKPVGSDARNEKTTWVTLYGLEAAEAEVTRLSDEAVELLGGLPGDPSFFRSFIRKLEKRTK